jgi:DNA-directed RNA polymerase subunit RPC12/RpoP
MMDVIVPVLIVITAALVLTVLVRWHARTVGYNCPECGHKFRITAWTDFKSPHYPHKKRLRCPACKKKSWCEAIPVEEIHSV